MTDTVERFSNRVENYVKYRPDYPREILSYLAANCGLTQETTIADIGAGTGISARMFLENGNRVLGVEPNASMRAAAVAVLAKFPWFRAIDGTSEATTLADSSIGMIVSAQAFHWFEPEKTRAEFKRILISGGHIVLIWNERQLGSTPFLVGYEALIENYAYDYGRVRHENIKSEDLQKFFQKEYGSATFQNEQVFDFEGIKGRMLSSSYMPTDGDATYAEMLQELQVLFAKHTENGRIRVLYDTRVYHSLG